MTAETDNCGDSSARMAAKFEEYQRQACRKSRSAYVKAAVLLLLALAAGVVIGAAGALFFVKKRMPPPPKAMQIGRSILERMEETVQLTPDEKKRLEEIVVARMTAADAVRQESLKSIRSEFDDMNDSIDEILGPDRSEKWEEAKKKQYGRFYRPKHDRHGNRSRREFDGDDHAPGAGGGPGPGMGGGHHGGDGGNRNR